MNNKSRPKAIAYQLIICFLSILGAILSFMQFGPSAVRLLSTWSLAILIIYTFAQTIKLIRAKDDSKDATCRPMFLGIAFIGLLTSSITSFVSILGGWGNVMQTGFSGVLIYVILPVLVIIDYIFFIKKGTFRSIDPFYWLALPATYIATIIFSAEMMNSAAYLRYPMPFLDFSATSLLDLLWSLGIFALFILGFGFVLVAVDICVAPEKSANN